MKMSLIKTAVCDDIQKELVKIRAAIDTYAKTHSELYFDIDEYSTAMDILHAVEKGKIYDIALLDICMPGILGTDAAEAMLAKSPDMGIIFLTTSDEYAVEAFAMNATHYLLKPFSQEQFNVALDRAVKKTEDQDYISLACVDGIYRVHISDIISIESQNHYLLATLSSGEVLRLRMKLSQMFEELQKYPGFIKVGASYVVNLDFVRRIFRNAAEMSNGAKIPIPRREIHIRLQNDRLIIVCNNTCLDNLKLSGSLPEGKSIGISSILSVCRRYDGNLDYKIENEVCSVCAVLNL